MYNEKVFFVEKNGNENFEVESLWCAKNSDGNYIVQNIPFIARRISFGDTIRVEFDHDECRYYFEDFVEVSGNSTIRMYFSDEKLIPKTRRELVALGCETEAF